jgi:hypothetical protein
LVFLNCSCRSENWTFIEWESRASAPCTLESKFGTYLENERLRPLHSTAVIFLMALAPSSSTKRTSK